MLWSGSSPGSVVRDGMWGFLLFAGATWLAITWSVLRLAPGDVAGVAGPVILFAAVTEAVRALAGTRTWWLNAGMALLFAATGGLLLADDTSSWTTPAALLGWYLLVRGAVDIAISMMSRETDRIWGLLMVVGVAETGLGFFAASAYARRAELVVVMLAGAALARAVADLVAALRLREATAAAQGERLLELPPERAIGVAGYTAGLTDFEAVGPAGGGRPKHRAMPRTSAAAMSDLAVPGLAGPVPGLTEPAPGSAGSAPGLAGSAPGLAGSAPGLAASAPGLTEPAPGLAASAPRLTDPAAGFAAPGRASDRGGPSGSFHDEVLRTTADLDAMLALAGVTGAAVPGAVARSAAEEQIEVPDTPEGAELPALEEAAAHRRAAPAEAVGTHRQTSTEEAAARQLGTTLAGEAVAHRHTSGRAGRDAAGHDEKATGGWITPEPGQETAAGWAEPGQQAAGWAESGQQAAGWAESGQQAAGWAESGQQAAGWAESGQQAARSAESRQEVAPAAARAGLAAAHRREAATEAEDAHRRAAHEEMAAMHRRAGFEDPSLPLLDPAARAAEPGLEDTSIIMRSRRLD